MKQITSELLKKSQCYAPTYQNGMSNHLPMVLIALDRMDANHSDIEMFYTNYTNHLEMIQPITDDMTIHHTNWRDHLGEIEYYPAYLKFFNSEQQKLGLNKFLNQTIQQLTNGIGAGAFHAFIRLGYAIDLYMDDQSLGLQEIIASLSYWAANYLNIGNPSSTIRYDSATQAFHHLQQKYQADPPLVFQQGLLIYQRMQAAIEQYQSLADDITKFPLQSDSLSQLINIAVQCHLQCNSFVTLHFVTATHALRLVLSMLDEEQHESLLNAFAHHMASAYLVIELPALSNEIDIQQYNDYDKLNWSPLYQQAITSQNDHSIKLLYSCQQHYEASNNPVYKFIGHRHITHEN